MTNAITAFPEGELKIFLEGPVGKLETLTNAGAQSITAVICHPHPQFGGTMHNKVVYTMARAFKEMGISTVRFNYRGVEKSEGTYAQAIGETDDLLAILNWVQTVKPNDKIWLAGFSFGTYVVARATQTFPAQQLVMIAPAVTSFNFNELTRTDIPLLVIQGEQDEVISSSAVFAWAESLMSPPELIKIADTGHFFHGKLVELRQLLIGALASSSRN